jgi:hypothetical protein
MNHSERRTSRCNKGKVLGKVEWNIWHHRCNVLQARVSKFVGHLDGLGTSSTQSGKDSTLLHRRGIRNFSHVCERDESGERAGTGVGRSALDIALSSGGLGIAFWDWSCLMQ